MEDITHSALYSPDLAPIPPEKRSWTKWDITALWVGMACLLGSCGESLNVLEDRDLGNGDWLLVRWDGADRIIHVIDDEQVLMENIDGVRVLWREGHSWTTCDGTLRLFQNGEEVLWQDYLDDSYLTESDAIQEAWRPAIDSNIVPDDSLDFVRLWDSLNAVPGNYPTRYRAQPENRDIIWLYRYE